MDKETRNNLIALGILGATIVGSAIFNGVYITRDSEANYWIEPVEDGELIYDRTLNKLETVSKRIPNLLDGGYLNIFRITRIQDDLYSIRALDETYMRQAEELVRYGCDVRDNSFLAVNDLEKMVVLKDRQCVEILVNRISKK